MLIEVVCVINNPKDFFQLFVKNHIMHEQARLPNSKTFISSSEWSNRSSGNNVTTVAFNAYKASMTVSSAGVTGVWQ